MTGITVGDRDAEISQVAVALDPTVSAVREAHTSGANLLLTHHPAVYGKLDDFVAGPSPAVHAGAVVYEAARLGVNLMNFHTALDVSVLGGAVMPKMLGVEPDAVL